MNQDQRAMRAIIVGCGRVGAGLAERLARAGHDVTVIDLSTHAFNRLEADFPGHAVRADGTDEDVLRRLGTQDADLFFALTEGDNRNVLAAQLATETFGVRHVVAKVNDPVRAEAYTMLGLATICRTRLLVDALARYSGLESDPGANGVREPERAHDDHDQPPAEQAPGARPVAQAVEG
jgi:trk/ktr system potassium uptake protein